MENTSLQEVTCPVCFDIFTNPHYLDCLHTVCLSCATKNQQTKTESPVSINSNPTSVSKINPPSKTAFVCPVCQRVTQNVFNLKPNPAAADAVTILKQTFLPNASQSNIKCDACTVEKATLECEECGTSLCQKCNNTIHAMGKYKTHRVGPIGSIKKFTKCSKHDKEEDFWCENDGIPLCIYCVQLEGHKEHECFPLKEKIERIVKETQAILTALQKQKSKVREVAMALTENFEQIEKAYQNVINDVAMSFRQIREALDKREQEIKNSFMKTKEDLLTTVNNQRKALLSIANKSNDIEVRMQNSISVSDMKLMTQQKALGEYICWILDKHLNDVQYVDTTSFCAKLDTKKFIENIERFGSPQPQPRVLTNLPQTRNVQNTTHSPPTTPTTTTTTTATGLVTTPTTTTNPQSSNSTSPLSTTSTAAASKQPETKPATTGKIQWVEIKRPFPSQSSGMRSAVSTPDLSDPTRQRGVGSLSTPSSAEPTASTRTPASATSTTTPPLPTTTTITPTPTPTTPTTTTTTITTPSRPLPNTPERLSPLISPSQPNPPANPNLNSDSTTNSTSTSASDSTTTTTSSTLTESGKAHRSKADKKSKQSKKKSSGKRKNKEEPKPLEKLPNFPNIYLIKSKDEFASVITSDTEKLLIVHFSAEWCPHFKNVAPKMEELGSKNPNTTAFYTLDIEKIPDIAQLCGVSSIPTFHFFRKKRKITELVGADLEKFELLVKQQLEAALSEQRS